MKSRVQINFVNLYKTCRKKLVNMLQSYKQEDKSMAKKSEMMGFKAAPETRKELEKRAKEQDRSMSYIINKIIEYHFWADNNIEEHGEYNTSIEELIKKIDETEGYISISEFIREACKGKYFGLLRENEATLIPYIQEHNAKYENA